MNFNKILNDLYVFTRQCVARVGGEKNTDILDSGSNMNKGRALLYVWRLARAWGAGNKKKRPKRWEGPELETTDVMLPNCT